jgi:hypothetical protein
MTKLEWATTWAIATVILVPVLRYLVVRDGASAAMSPWFNSLLLSLSFTSIACLIGIIWPAARG